MRIEEWKSDRSGGRFSRRGADGDCDGNGGYRDLARGRGRNVIDMCKDRLPDAVSR